MALKHRLLISSIIISRLLGFPHVDFKKDTGVVVTMAPVALAQPPIQDPIAELNTILTSENPNITRAKAILGSPGYSDAAYNAVLGLVKDTFTKVVNQQPVPHNPTTLAQNVAALFDESSLADRFNADMTTFVNQNAELSTHLNEGYLATDPNPSIKGFLLYVIEKEQPTIVPVRVDVSVRVTDALTVFGNVISTADSSIASDFKHAYSTLNSDEKAEFERQFKTRFSALYRGYTTPNQGTSRAFNAIDCLERVQAIQTARANNVPDERMYVRYGRAFVESVPSTSMQRTHDITKATEALKLGYEYIEGTQKLLSENQIASDPRAVLERVQSSMEEYSRAFGPLLKSDDAALITGIAKNAQERLEALASARRLSDPNGEVVFLEELTREMGTWKQSLDSIARRLQDEALAFNKEAGALASEFTPENVRPSTFDINSSTPLGRVERLLSGGLLARAVVVLDLRALEAEISRHQDHLRTITDPEVQAQEASRMGSAVASWKTRTRSIVDRYIQLYGDTNADLRARLDDSLRGASAIDVSKIYYLLASLELPDKYEAAKQSQADTVAASSRYRTARASFTKALERIEGARAAEKARAIRDTESEIRTDIQTMRTALATLGLDSMSLGQRADENPYGYAVRLNDTLSSQTFDAAINIRTREAELLPVVEKYVAMRSEIQQITGEVAFATEQNRTNPTAQTQSDLAALTQRLDAAKVRWMGDMQETIADLRARSRGDSAVTVVTSLRKLSSTLDANSQLEVYTQLTLKLARAKRDLDALSLQEAAYQANNQKARPTVDQVRAVTDSIPNPDVLRYFLEEGIKATERIVGYYEGTRRGAPYAVNQAWVDAMLGFITRAQTTVAAGVFKGNAEPEVGALLFRAYLATHGLGDLDTLETKVRTIDRALDKINVRLSALYSVQNIQSLDEFEARLNEISDDQEREFFDRPDTLADLQQPINDLKGMIAQARRTGNDVNALLQSAQTRDFILRQYTEIESIMATDVPEELRERFALQFYSSWNKQVSPRPANDYTELRSSVETILNDTRFLAFDNSLAQDAGRGGLVGRQITLAQTFNFTLSGPRDAQGDVTDAGTGPTGVNQTAQQVEVNQNGEVLSGWRTLTPEVKYAIYQLMGQKYGREWNTNLNSAAFDQFAVLVLLMQNSSLNQGQAFSPLNSSYGALFLSRLGPEILRFNDPGMTQFLVPFFTQQSFIAINAGNHLALEQYFKVAAEKLQDIYPRIFDVEGNYRQDAGNDNRIRLPSENIGQLLPSRALNGAINLPPVVYKVVRTMVEGVQKAQTAYIQDQPGQTPNPLVTEADYDAKMVDVQLRVPTTAVSILRILPDLSELVLNIHPESGEFLTYGGTGTYNGFTSGTASFTDVTRRNTVTVEENSAIEGRNARISDQRNWALTLNALGEGNSVEVGAEANTTEQTVEGEQFEGVGSKTKATTTRVKVLGSIQNLQGDTQDGERTAMYGTIRVDRADSVDETTRTPEVGAEEEKTREERKLRDLIEASMTVIDMKDPRYRYAYFLRTEWDPSLSHPFDSDAESGGYITRIYMYGKTPKGYVLMNERTIPYAEARNLYKTFTPMAKALERMHGEVKESFGPVDFKSSVTGFFVGAAIIDGKANEVETGPVMQGLSAAGQVGPFGMLVMHETTRAGRTAVGGGVFDRNSFGSVAGFRYGQRDVAIASDDIAATNRQSFIKNSQEEAQQVAEGHQVEFLFTTSEKIAARAFVGIQKLNKDQKGDPEAIFGALWESRLGGYESRLSLLSNQGTVSEDGSVSGQGTRTVGGSIVAPSLVDAAVAYAIAKKAMDEEWGGVGVDKTKQAAAALQYYFSKNPELNDRLIAAGVWSEEDWRTLVTQLTRYFEKPVIGIDEVTGGYAFLTQEGEPIYHLGQLYAGHAPETGGMDVELIGAVGGGQVGGALKLDAAFADRSVFGTGGAVLMPFAEAVFGGGSIRLGSSVRVFGYGTAGMEELTNQKSVFGGENPTVDSNQALLGATFRLDALHPSLTEMTATPFGAVIRQTDDPKGADRSEATQVDVGLALNAISSQRRVQLTFAGQVWTAEQETAVSEEERTRVSAVGRVGVDFLGIAGLSRLSGAFTGTLFMQNQANAGQDEAVQDGDFTIERTNRSRSDTNGFSFSFTFFGQY